MSALNRKAEELNHSVQIKIKKNCNSTADATLALTPLKLGPSAWSATVLDPSTPDETSV
jgi:hypothetical protein